jgi:carbamoylphosphate synthase small subunit
LLVEGGGKEKEEECFQLPAGFESRRVWPAALIISRLCAEGEHSHWRARQSLGQWLRREGVPGLSGIDVRLLTKKIREKGTLKAKVLLFCCFYEFYY